MDHQSTSRNSHGDTLGLSQMPFGESHDEHVFVDIQRLAAQRTQISLGLLALLISFTYCLILSLLGY